MSKKGNATVSRISDQYRREPRFVMTWKRLRTNVGAIIGLAILLILIFAMLYSFIFVSYEDITKMNGKHKYEPPSAEHPFGTDEMGRDLFKRCLYGTRYSIAIAFGAVGFGLVIGVFFGSISGYFGGWVDQLIMRLTDILTSIPGTLLGMVIVTILGARLINLLIAVGVSCIGGFIRLSRASVLTVRSNEYVESAKAIGMSSGYFGGMYDSVIMRVMDIIMAVPGFLLAVCISAALGSGIFNTALAIGIGCIPGYARMFRALVLSIRDQEYVEAARVAGASSARIMFRQIVPNILSPIIVDTTLRIGGCILMISSLSFIGLGVRPPTPEWGSMVSAGRQYIRSFWPMSTFPGLAIMLTLLGFNLFGDGLRDALDPKLKN